MARILKNILFSFSAVAFAIQIGSADPMPIKIGALIHLTGDLAPQGSAFREGIELATSEINSQGGINGFKIDVVFEDTALKADQAFKAAKKLLEIDGVIAGLISTAAETKSAGTLFESKRIPLICLWDSSPEIEAIGTHVFGIGTWTPSSGEKVADHMFKTLHIRKAAVINNIDEWSLAVSTAFTKHFENLGGKVVFTDSITPDSGDFRSTISRMRGTNPDALYSPIGFNTASFFKQLRQVKFDKPIYESDNLNKEIIEASGGATEQVYQTQSSAPQGASFSHMTELYQVKFGKNPTMPIYTAWGYDAVQILTLAIKKSKGDTHAISEKVYAVQNYDGASGNISISAEGSSRADVGLFQVRNGALKLVDK